MIRIRPYQAADANIVLSWCQGEKAYYQWTAGMFGNYPISPGEFKFAETVMPFTAFDESGMIGFFTLRNPGESLDELRFGFVIVNPEKRGKGYGKAMLQLGLKFAFELFGATRASLGVFENNPSAYYCYKAAGFQDIVLDAPKSYHILGEDWACKELMAEKP